MTTADAASVFVTPAPRFDPAALVALVRREYGAGAEQLHALPGERDQNARVGDLVLKVYNAAEQPDAVALEVAALDHLARTDPGLPVPRVVRTLAGDAVTTLVDENGTAHLVRAISLVPGAPVEGTPVGADLAEAVGELCARAQLGLQGFFHPAAGRELDWDVRRLAEVVAAVPADAVRGRLAELASRVGDALAALPGLPAGVQHGDVTLTNVLLDEGVVSGLVDLGDMHHTTAVADLAATLTSVLRNTAPEQPVGTWRLAAAVLRGYQRRRPLLPEEVDVLGELVIARLLLTEAISATRAPVHVENTAYITQYDAANRRVLDAFTALDGAALRRRVRRLTGLAAPGLRSEADGDLRARRRAVQAGDLSPLFYAEPLDVVAAQDVWLIDRSGRRYLDGYNNVAVVGHSHPNVVQAITRQAARLHTHSRYLHPNVIELAERLVATMPAGSGLDTCLFVTSGTEANELAWRLATEFTGLTGDAAAGGRGGLIVGSHAYHGASKQMADLSSNEWPPGYAPADIATYEAPVQPDGELTGEEARRRIASAATDLTHRFGIRPAMVIADSMFTSEGVRTGTPEFMQGLVDGAHAAGALFVADEVQVGFGRTGPQLWRFAALGMRPDVVTLGKPMGAGYPIAAVLTRREVAEALGARYEFFSTFAGNPVGTAASLAVLDLIEDEALGDRALELGESLRVGIGNLRERHPELGEVRGVGLIAGVDLPSKPRARQVVEALKARGVLVGSTGRHGNVLKVRPPLAWRGEHVELFLTALDSALGA